MNKDRVAISLSSLEKLYDLCGDISLSDLIAFIYQIKAGKYQEVIDDVKPN